MGPLWTGCGSRNRSMASQMMIAPMATSVRAFASAARIPTRCEPKVRFEVAGRLAACRPYHESIERQGIAEIVSGVRHQGEAMGKVAGDRLGRDERQREGDRKT